jgi:hypothetical protein
LRKNTFLEKERTFASVESKGFSEYYRCAVCGGPEAVFVSEQDPKVRHCSEHMPGLSEAERAYFRRVVTPRRLTDA